jgi:hypothetical protein
MMEMNRERTGRGEGGKKQVGVAAKRASGLKGTQDDQSLK